MFVEFFGEKYLLATDCNTCPPTLYADEVADEKLKIEAVRVLHIWVSLGLMWGAGADISSINIMASISCLGSATTST